MGTMNREMSGGQPSVNRLEIEDQCPQGHSITRDFDDKWRCLKCRTVYNRTCPGRAATQKRYSLTLHGRMVEKYRAYARTTRGFTKNRQAYYRACLRAGKALSRREYEDRSGEVG